MICISIGDYGLDACRKALKRCEKYRRQFPDLVAEIRLDLCGLGEDEVHELFSGSRIPLIATCMKRSSHLYEAAVLAGAAYVDVNVFSFINLKKENQALLRSRRTKIILSFHDYQMTPGTDALVKVYREAVAAGADIVKIVTTAETTADALRVLDLYKLLKDGRMGRKKVPLIAFAMGDAGRFSRLEAHRQGAPFTYCALKQKYIVAPGMFTVEEVGSFQDRTAVSGTVDMPASKSVAQRAIIAAMLAKGESEFHNCTRCRDIDSAIGVAKQFAQEAYVDKGGNLIIRGGFPPEKKKNDSPFSSLISMSMQSSGRTAFVGESGLLSRLCIPVVAQFGESVTVTGEGSLMDRHMYGCKEAMEELGASCILTAEETLPAVVCGPIKGGEITISGKKGSQFITGLLMALPLSKKDSVLRVQNATSVPYILLTVDVMQKFGVTVEWHREGDELVFNIPGKQKYFPTEMTFEGDWSAAVNFIVPRPSSVRLPSRGSISGPSRPTRRYLTWCAAAEPRLRNCPTTAASASRGAVSGPSISTPRILRTWYRPSPYWPPSPRAPRILSEWPACATRRATVPWSWRRASMPWAFRPGSTETLWTSPV